VRARNAYEWSAWSDVSAFPTAASTSDAPAPPFAGTLRPDAIALHWRPPDVDNGSRVRGYVLRMRREIYGEAAGPASESNPARTCGEWRVAYAGPMTRYLASSLEAGCFYAFAVAAVNGVGVSNFSKAISFRTPTAQGLDDGYAGPENAVLLRAGDLWLECWDHEQQHVFYFNRVTGSREREAPPAFLEIGKSAQSFKMAPEELARIDGEKQFRFKRFQFLKSLRLSFPIPDKPQDSVSLIVRREMICLDSLAALRRMPASALRRRLNVQFDGENGIDSGGLTKDWYLQLSRALRGDRHFFTSTDREELEVAATDHYTLDDWRQVGRFIAKAVWDQQCLDLPFAPPFYDALRFRPEYDAHTEDGVANVVEERSDADLQRLLVDVDLLDAALAKSLRWILNHDVDNDILGATFSVGHNGEDLALVDGGADLSVSNANKRDYVYLISRWRVRDRCAMEMDALASGASELGCTPALLKPFDPAELDLLLNGRREIDVDELAAHAEYRGVDFDEKHVVAIWFWQLMHEFGPEDRASVLSFATGSNKVPLDGFTPPLTITLQCDRLDALPTSHTCFNQVVLPTYSSFDLVRKQFKFAIDNSKSFELS